MQIRPQTQRSIDIEQLGLNMLISKGVSCVQPLLLLAMLPWLLHVLPSPAATASAQTTAPAPAICPDRCGDVSIPYPFGIGTSCARPGLDITCNSTGDGAQVAFMGTGNIPITNISLAEGQLRVELLIAFQCYNETSTTNQSYPWAEISEMYKFSKTQNKFFAVGCQTLAYIEGQNAKTSSYASGCVSICDGPSSVTDGACDGMGCCQTSIPAGLTDYNVSFGGYDHSGVWNFSPCSYAFLAEQSSYNFSKAHLSGHFGLDGKERVPVVIDWAIRDNSASGEACRSKNSEPFQSDNGPGYRCRCQKGYDGNPYLEDGCDDIDECTYPEQYSCHGTCNNIAGGYECTCPNGMHGDAKNGTCVKSRETFPLFAKLVVGISGGIVILVAVGSFILMTCQKRKHEREKEMFFDRNGGLRLYEEMRSRRVDTVAVFSKADLERATNNFDDDGVLGAGGHGMVYKGVLDDGREVAIKKSKVVDEDQKEEFVNEIIILSQINHKNVVRLFGCCLEVDVPMLVYEFVPNGTLYDAIHNSKGPSAPMPLATRMRIATESAEALAYLHSSVTRSIVHGDVKSLNILLDDKGRAKVSDFGASQLVPMDESGFVQFMQGTLGYLDPESLLSHQLTDKSDVYSFGVVLLELITGKKPIYSDGSAEKKSLASGFLVAMKENKLQEILDEHVLNELGGMDQMLRDVAGLAKQCLSVRGEERPSMKEVAERLHAVARDKQHPWGLQGSEETRSLLGDSTHEYNAGEMSVNQSLDSRLVLDINIGGR